MNMKKFTIILLLILAACETTEKKDEIEFEGAKFGLITKSKQTLETTLHYRTIYMTPAGSSDKKAVVDIGSQEMGLFPTHGEILSGTEYVLIDTIRHGNMQPATHANHTLYVNPKVFTKDEFHVIVEFVKSNFKNPIHENRLIKWLDEDVLGLEPDSIYYTVYAVVYQNISAFEETYAAGDGKNQFVIKVDDHLRVSKVEDGLPMESGYDYTFRNDTLFYPDFETDAYAIKMLEFKDASGKRFGDRVKVLFAAKPY